MDMVAQPEAGANLINCGGSQERKMMTSNVIPVLFVMLGLWGMLVILRVRRERKEKKKSE
ncbi:MAG: hypothetical protein ABSA83_06375 [Verrucomicrobiota bacterium]|jgi:hypothetical protein